MDSIKKQIQILLYDTLLFQIRGIHICWYKSYVHSFIDFKVMYLWTPYQGLMHFWWENGPGLCLVVSCVKISSVYYYQKIMMSEFRASIINMKTTMSLNVEINRKIFEHRRKRKTMKLLHFIRQIAVVAATAVGCNRVLIYFCSMYATTNWKFSPLLK